MSQTPRKHIAVINDRTLLMLDAKHTPHRIVIQTPTSGHALLSVAHEHNLDSLWILPTSKTSRWAEAYAQDFTQFGGVYDGRASQDGESRLRALHLWYRNGGYDERRTISVHFPEHDSRWGFAEITAAPTLLYSVLYLRNALQCEIEWGPGSTGKTLMEELNKGARASWVREADISMLPRRATARDLQWKGVPEQLPDGPLYFHTFDKNSMYLAACTSANLGEGTPDLIIEPESLDLRLPGIWATEITRSDCPYYQNGIHWLWTPELEFLRRTNVAGTHVTSAYVWPKYHTTLRSWGEHLWKARQELAIGDYRYPEARQAAYTAIKRVATQSLGWLARKPDNGALQWYRPDWWNMIVSNARAKMMYKIFALNLKGIQPCWVNVDELGFLSPNPDVRTAIHGMLARQGQLGGFKQSYTLPATPELLEQLRSAKHNDCHDYLLDWALKGE